MSIALDNVQDFTDAELLKLTRYALASLMLGKSVTIAGRALTREDAPSLRETIEWLEQRIEADSADTGGTIALVQFVRER